MGPRNPQDLTRRRLLKLAGLTVISGYAMPRALAGDAFGQALLKGAGSTFVLPLSATNTLLASTSP